MDVLFNKFVVFDDLKTHGHYFNLKSFKFWIFLLFEMHKSSNPHLGALQDVHEKPKTDLLTRPKSNMPKNLENG